MSWNGHNPGGMDLQAAFAETPFQQQSQWVGQAAMSFKFEFPDQFLQVSGVRSVGTGKVEGEISRSAGRADTLSFQNSTRQPPTTVAANSLIVLLQRQQAGLTKRTEITIQDPFSAENAGLREDQCLQDLFE